MGRGQHDFEIGAAIRAGSPARVAAGIMWMSDTTLQRTSGPFTLPVTRRPAVRELRYPQGCLLAFCGPPGVGKTTLAQRALPVGVEVLCVDELAQELLVAQPELADNESWALWPAAFERLWEAAGQRLGSGQAAVLHLSGLRRWQYQKMSDLAGWYERSCHMIMLDGSTEMCLQGQRARGFRPIPDEQMRDYAEALYRFKLELSAPELRHAGVLSEFGSVAVLDRAAVNTLQRVTFAAEPVD